MSVALTSDDKVNLVVAALVVLAVGLAVFTLWYWRHTRPEPEVLGRLEVMSSRRWREADYSTKQTSLEEIRHFSGGEGPQLGAADALITGQHEIIRPDEGEPLVGRSLAELVELVDAADAAAPPTGEPIGDPEVLKALGLDDESLGLGPASLVGLADTVSADEDVEGVPDDNNN